MAAFEDRYITSAAVSNGPDAHGLTQRLEAFLEVRLFRWRVPVLLVFLVISALLGWQAVQLRPDASFQKMIPLGHPFVANYLKYENELRPLGNVIRVAVENTKGDIYEPQFLDTLRKVTDEVFYTPGVDRGAMKSLWTPNVLWLEVTEDGTQAGQVIPQGFDGSAASIEKVRSNTLRARVVGSLVANDHRSAVVLAPLLEVDPQTGKRLDYGRLSTHLEEKIRDKYQSESARIHITGFAKIIGDLIDGARPMAIFLGITVLLTVVVLYAYSRCWRSTWATVFCCGLAVLWQMGLMRLLGFGLDPYSILMPFLTFAIGVSHAVQNINTMAAQKVRGASNIDAARATFRLLFIPGTIALVCDAVGFSTLLVIDIGAIQELALSASIGVAVIIFTKMFLLPVLMSYLGISASGLRHQREREASPYRWARAISTLATPRRAAWAAGVAAVLLVGGHWLARDLRIGDLDPGAPELRKDARYNRDVDFMARHFSTSPDVFVAMAITPKGECGAYAAAAAVDQFQWEIENLPAVESTSSLFTAMKDVLAGQNGADLRWRALTRNRFSSNSAHRMLPTELYNNECSMVPILAFLKDHKAETLAVVVDAAKAFATRNDSEQARFILAAGNAGVEAATNIVIKQSERMMLLLVYGIVMVLVFWEFRSWRVTLCIMVPLYITSILCEALMAVLGLGVKVATLPVIALGIGIGVDYGIYIYNRLEGFLREGLALQQAYFETLKSTGAAVALTGVMLALGVATWIGSDIKFQADMGLLLTFMLLWNMVGAVVLIPALSALLRVDQFATKHEPVV